jgi:Zn finger protein HypA/HybF involved in hydrogenase expression
MLNDRDRLEQELRAKAEEAIRKLLDALPDKAEITMSDMEALTGEMGHELMQGTIQSLSESQQAEPNEVRCEQCNMPMHKRGKRKKQVITLRGEIEVERQYYACPCCDAGTFPPG